MVVRLRFNKPCLKFLGTWEGREGLGFAFEERGPHLTETLDD